MDRYFIFRLLRCFWMSNSNVIRRGGCGVKSSRYDVLVLMDDGHTRAPYFKEEETKQLILITWHFRAFQWTKIE